MVDVISDGRTKVWWVPEIEDIDAPTVTELNAGTSLESFITSDGLIGFEAETAEVDTTALNSVYDTKGVGRAGFSGTMLRMKKQVSPDTAYDTMIRDAAGYVVIRRDVLSGGAWTLADDVEVYPVACGETKRLPPEANSLSRYEVPVMVSPAPSLRAVVATGA